MVNKQAKRIVEDDIILEIPYSYLLTITNLANPVTLIEAPGPNEIIDICSMAWILLASNETAIDQTTPGALKVAFGDDSAQKAFETISFSDMFNNGYYFNYTRVPDAERMAKVGIINKPIKLFYDGEISDNGAEGKLRVVITYRIIEVI